MSYEVSGKLIEKYDTQRVSDRFQKRDFVIEFTEMINGQPSQYPSFIKLTLTQQKVDIIDRFEIGNSVKVSFNLRGSRYEKEGKINYFTSLDAWRIEQSMDNNNGNNNGGNASNNAGNNGGNGNNTNNNNGGSWSGNNTSNNSNNSGNWSGGNNGNNASAPAFSNTAAAENSDDLPF